MNLFDGTRDQRMFCPVLRRGTEDEAVGLVLEDMRMNVPGEYRDRVRVLYHEWYGSYFWHYSPVGRMPEGTRVVR